MLTIVASADATQQFDVEADVELGRVVYQRIGCTFESHRPFELVSLILSKEQVIRIDTRPEEP